MARIVVSILALLLSIAGCSLPPTTTTTSAPAEFSTKPFIMINSGGHTNYISSISTDHDGDLVLTTSYDRTARIWSTADGHLVSVLRPPLSPDYYRIGQLFSGALSPDGRLAAIGGWDFVHGSENSWSIYIFDVASEQVVQRLPTNAGVPINSLTWSADGDYLAAGLSTDPNAIGQGVRVWDTRSWTLTKSLSSSGDGGADSVSFDNQDRLAVSFDDGYVELYDSSFNLLGRTQPVASASHTDSALSPDGSKVAVWYPYNLTVNNDLTVNVLSGKDLSPLGRLSTSNINPSFYKAGAYLNKLIWSSNSRNLYGAGLLASYRDSSIIRKWPMSGSSWVHDLHLPENSVITSLAFLRDGRIAFADTSGGWGIIGGDNPVLVDPETAQFSDAPDRFQISNDGTGIAFTLTDSSSQLQVFSTPSRQYQSFYGDVPGYQQVQTSAPDVSVGDMSTENPTINGTPVSLFNDGTVATAAAFSSQYVALGWLDGVELFDHHGNWLWKDVQQSEAINLNLSPDGRFLVGAFNDGTIRWFRTDNGNELLDFFPDPDGKRWILWTPNGYYDASPGGEDLIGWAVGTDEDHAEQITPISRFRAQFYRPDIINNVLQTLTLPAAPDIHNLLPAVINILAPENDMAASGGPIDIHYTIQSPSGLAVTQIEVLYDGRPQGTRDAAQSQLPQSGDTSLMTGDISVDPPTGTRQVALIAVTDKNTGSPAILQLAPGAPTVKAKPNLYILAVGINAYAAQGLQLHYSAQDAVDFAAAMQAHAGIYQSVQARVLTDTNATRAAILNGLSWLETASADGDVAVLFLSGHGTSDDSGNYYYITQDTSPAAIASTAISSSDLVDAVRNIKAKVVVFLDTCHSGAILSTHTTGLINELQSAENGSVVFAASEGDQLSQESATWGNGAFTKELIAGIDGGASPDGVSPVDIFALGEYLDTKVPQLTNQTQLPTLVIPQAIPDFAIAQ